MNNWFSVRCLFRHGGLKPEEKKYVYEERITLWNTASFDKAIEAAEKEAEQYSKNIDVEYLGLAQAYHLFDEPTSNSEIFSLMRESDYPASEYLDNFFDTGFERAQNTD